MRKSSRIRGVFSIVLLGWATFSCIAGEFDSEGDPNTFGSGVEMLDSSIHDGALRLTSHEFIENHNGTAKLPLLDQDRIGSFSIEFDLTMFGSPFRPGDGMTLTFGEIPEGKGDGRHGFEFAEGISIDFDTYDNGDDPSSIELIVSDKTVANVLFRFPLREQKPRRVVLHWDEDGLDLSYDERVIYEDQGTGDYRPEIGHRFAFTAASRADNGLTVMVDRLSVKTTLHQPFVTPGVVISEVLPIPHAGVKDEDLETVGWIELYNGTSTEEDLSGWALQCGDSQWSFPSVLVPAFEHLIVFASGKNRVAAEAPLHTGFVLPMVNGEVILIGADGVERNRIAYDEASPDVSVGWIEPSVDAIGFLKKPSPGKPNRGSLSLHAEAPAVTLSHSGGIVREPVVVSISSGELPAGGVIRYSVGSKEPGSDSPVYSAPILIDSSTVLRAAVFAPDFLSGAVAESAFVFLDPEVEAFTSNLPVVIAETAGVNIDSEYAPWVKRKYRAVHTSVFSQGADGRTRLDVEPEFAEFGAMRVRGHSSATNFPKKQYAWEVRDSRGEDKDVSVLGLPAESDWILAAPYSDKSLMRNVLAFELGRELLGDGGGSRTEFVELFVNQNGDDVTMADYQGVYVLTEKIKKGADRVPIQGLSNLETDSEKITGGYIFKIDKGLDWDEKIRTKRGALSVGFVDPDEPNSKQKAYLEQFLNAYEEALESENFADETSGYAAFIDIDSFIHLDWMVEIFREIDGWWISSYFTKDRGSKMRAAPVWDYNLSLGNAHYSSGYLPTGWHRDAHPSGGHLWFRRLHDDPKFSHRSWKRYFELRKGLLSTENLFEIIDRHADLLRESSERNFQRWPVLGRYVWPNAPGYRQRQTYQAEVEWMKDWLKTRLDWIDQQYVAPPVFTRNADRISISLPPGVDDGGIFFTTDGSDPGYRGGIKWKSFYSSETSPAEVLVPSRSNGGARLKAEDWTSFARPANQGYWKSAASGAVGYESEPEDYADLIRHDVNEMRNMNTSCFIRLPFELKELPSAQAVKSLALRMRCDDGFVAYLNGVRIAEKNAPDQLTWDASATGTVDDRKAVRWEAFEISEHAALLKQGQNMLAIHGLNQSTTSTDALWIAQLAVIDQASMLPGTSSRRYTEPLPLEDLNGTQLRAVVLSGKRWGVTADLMVE